MKDGHLLSQHAVSGQWMRAGDDGGDGEKRRRIRKEEEAETKEERMICECEKNRQRKRKTLSQCSKIRVVKCQAHFSRLRPSALSFLRIHTVSMHDSHYPSATEWRVSVQCASGHCSQFSTPDTTSNVCSSIIHPHNAYWWRDMFGTAHLIHHLPHLLPFACLS